MLREGYIRLNLQSVERFNKKTKKNHDKNMERLRELKSAYLERAKEMQRDEKEEISKKDIEIAKLKEQIESLKEERDEIKRDLDQIPDFYKI